VPRENVLCQLPELDGQIKNDGVVRVSEEIHGRCYDAACRHAGVELCVGPHTPAVEFSGCYDVRCVADSAAVSLAARSQGLCSKVLTGVTMQLRIPNARLHVWPWFQPTASQPAVLTLPGGAKATGTLHAAKLTDDGAPASACQPIEFEAAVGRGAHAYYHLKRPQNVHGLNGDGAKQAEKDRMEQTVRDLRAQGLDDEAAPPGWLSVDRDGSNSIPDQVDVALSIASAAAQLARTIRGTAAPLASPLTASALTGLKNAVTRMRADTQTAATDAPMSDSAHSGCIHIPTDEHEAKRIRADVAEFNRKLQAENKQTTVKKSTAAQNQRAHGQPRSLEPPLTPLPANGVQVVDRLLATAHPPCRLSVAQTLRTGAPDHGLGMPFGKPMNQCRPRRVLLWVSPPPPIVRSCNMNCDQLIFSPTVATRRSVMRIGVPCTLSSAH
jgi:hypothetical protein